MTRMHSHKFKHLRTVALATALGTFALAAPTAFAHGPGKGHDRHGHYGKDYRKAEKRYYKDREKAYKRYQKDVRKAYKEEQKAHRRWARGQYIPRDYLVDRYYIRDYRAYDLAPPPHGYAYVRPYQDDDTYYMVQLASGLISQIFGH